MGKDVLWLHDIAGHAQGKNVEYRKDIERDRAGYKTAGPGMMFPPQVYPGQAKSDESDQAYGIADPCRGLKHCLK